MPPRSCRARGAGDAQAGHFRQAGEQVRGQRFLVPAHALHPEGAQVLDRHAQPDRLGDRRGAGLELVRQLVPRGAVEVHRGDHVAAGEERRHLLQQLGAAVQHADPGRPHRLVAGPRVEVGSHRGHVHRHVRHRLRAVHQRHRAGGADACGHLRHGVDRPQHVGDVGECHELHVAPFELSVELRGVELAGLVHLQVAQLRAALFAQLLPRHDVGVVLHLGDEHRVARVGAGSAGGAGGDSNHCGPTRTRRG